MNIETADFKNIVKAVIREAIANKVVTLPPVNEADKKGYIGPSLKPIGQLKSLTPKTITPAFAPADNKSKEAPKKDDKKVNEAGLTSEGDPANAQMLMMTIKQVTQGIGDDAKIAAMSPEQAKQKLTVVRSILSSLLAKGGMMQEASYKVVSPNAVDTSKEDKARTIQTDPKVNEIDLNNPDTAMTVSMLTIAAAYIAPLIGIGIDELRMKIKSKYEKKDKNGPKVNEASYKVVSPNAIDTAKEDKARRIQPEPEVNETAYKTQGPSCKTFDDSPQFPDAVNDPKNA